MTPLRRFASSASVLAILFLAALSIPAAAQQATTAPPASSGATSKTDPAFLAAADEVLADMSEITGWKLKSPLKKSIRSRREIHDYVIREMNDDKDAKERYASARSAEAFGLIPKDFDLDHFMVDLLTEQIAGLYDPEIHEFYIADWISPDDQKMVMSHELTHALQDQSYNIEPWVKAARPNDDAELARESVLEGSAMAGMLDYMLRDKGLKLKDLPDIDPSAFVGDLSDTPMLKKAPPFIKDSLMFPYFAGLTFSLSIIRTSGWPGFDAVFAHPPVNSQQIMHPALYRSNKVAPPIKTDLPVDVPDSSWVKMEENSLGEFGLQEVLKQFLDENRAKSTAAAWNGDSYTTFEQKGTKHLMLFTRVRFSSVDAAARFFGQYSEALEVKYTQRTHLFRRPDFFTFDIPDSSVFLRCFDSECIVLERSDRKTFLQWNRKLGWEAIPSEPQKPEDQDIKSTQILFTR